MPGLDTNVGDMEVLEAAGVSVKTGKAVALPLSLKSRPVVMRGSD